MTNEDEKQEEKETGADLFHKRVILVKAVTHGISNQRKDKTATEEVAETFGGSSTKMGKYVKNLFSPESMKPILETRKAITDCVKSCTIYPYGDSGWYVLPVKSFNIFQESISKLKELYNKTVDKFISNYDKNVEEAKKRLGSLFNEKEYPPAEEIRARFNIEIMTDTIPHGTGLDQLIEEISQEEIDDLKSRITNQNKKALEVGQKLIWGRLYDYIERIIKTLNKPDRMDSKGKKKSPIFHKTMIESLRELIPMLSKLNITDDPIMEEMRKELEKSVLMTSSVEDIRDNETKREEVKKVAKKFLTKIPK